MGESNSPPQFGKLLLYRLTNPATIRRYKSLANMLAEANLVGAPGFEPGVTSSQKRHVSRYTTLRSFNN
jgi:hypothetical protein